MSEEPPISRHYQGQDGRRYAEHHQSDPYHLGYQLDLEYFKPFLKSTDVVLDFGCGNGGMLRLLAAIVRQAEGIEVNPHAAESARSLGLKVYSSLSEIPDSRAYDAVISNHVLEHVRDVASTLERIGEKMRPSGLLLLKLPMEDWRASDHAKWSADDIDRHLHTWTPKLIGNVLYEAGFAVEAVRIITSAWHPKLFPLERLRIGLAARWALAVVKKRRQLFVVGRRP